MLRPDTFALTGLLALLVAFGPVATDLYVPSMPEIGRLLGASPAEVQLTLSSYLVGFAFGQIIYGAISASRFCCSLWFFFARPVRLVPQRRALGC